MAFGYNRPLSLPLASFPSAFLFPFCFSHWRCAPTFGVSSKEGTREKKIYVKNYAASTRQKAHDRKCVLLKLKNDCFAMKIFQMLLLSGIFSRFFHVEQLIAIEILDILHIYTEM